MQLAVLGSLESWYVKDLRRAAQDRHEITPLTFRDLESTIGAEAAQNAPSDFRSGECDLAQADCVLVRTMPPGSLEQVVFRMNALAELDRLGPVVMNPPRAVEIAVDKYLATARLQAAGLRVPRTWCGQTADAAMEAFADFGDRVVLKPLFGSEGRGITRLDDEALALRAFKMLEQMGAVIYLQEFIDHEGADMRLLVIGERVFGMRRRNHDDWRTNVSRGAKAEPLEVTPSLAELAFQAAEAVGAPLAGVDFLPALDGTLYAIEVNAVPGWKALARVNDLDVAAHVLSYLETVVEERAS